MTNLQIAKIGGVIAALTTQAAAITAAVSPDHVALVSALVGGGTTTLLGVLYVVLTVYVAIVGAENTRIDEGLEAGVDVFAGLSEDDE